MTTETIHTTENGDRFALDYLGNGSLSLNLLGKDSGGLSFSSKEEALQFGYLLIEIYEFEGE